MTQVALGGSGEFDRIRAIAGALGADAATLGDDTAAVPAGQGTLVVSTDVSVEGVHFQRAWLDSREIGWRAAASALSDLAAAAALPAGLTAAVTVPAEFPEEALVALMRGVGDAARYAGCQVLGGDLSTGAALSLAVTVIGYADPPMSRCGAAAGDGVWVTGALGGARAALLAWRKGEAPDSQAREAFAHPLPRIDVAQWLRAHGATAMMDISDGLGGDAQHLAAASGVGIRLELERVPIHPAVHAAAAAAGEDPAAFAAVGGEDYELLVTLPNGFSGGAACLAATGVPLTRVGLVRRDAGVVATLMGRVVNIAGYQHPL
jgi:thiamine-monophosphate kinase